MRLIDRLQCSVLCTGAMYICTEDAFPNRRLVQMVSLLRQRCPDIQLMNISFTDNIYVEHCADVVCTMQCIYLFCILYVSSVSSVKQCSHRFMKSLSVFKAQKVVNKTVSLIIFESFWKITESVLHQQQLNLLVN